MARLKQILPLFQPAIQGQINTLSRATLKEWLRMGIFVGFALVIGTGTLLFAWWLSTLLNEMGPLGRLLALKTFSLIFLSLMLILILGALLNGISIFYLAQDLSLLHTLPIGKREFFRARFLECFWTSSWTLTILASLVLWTYGTLLGVRWIFYPLVPLIFAVLSSISVALGLALAFSALSMFPARKMKDFVLFLGVLTAVSAYLFLRFLRPERWFQPEGFLGLTDLLATIHVPRSPILPSQWACFFLEGLLWPSSARTWLWSLPLLATAAGMFFLCEKIFLAHYADGWWKSQENRFSHRLLGSRFVVENGEDRSLSAKLAKKLSRFPILLLKDLRLLLRDAQRWSQVILIAALVIVYVYNFRVLDFRALIMEFMRLEWIMAYINLIFCSLVLAALAVRFAYPAVSLEGRALWLLRSLPLSMRSYLWSKFLFFFALMLPFGGVLLGVTNAFMGASLQVQVLCFVIFLPIAAFLIALALGLGAMWPQPNVEHLLKITTSFGAFIFVGLALLGLVLYFTDVAFLGMTCLTDPAGSHDFTRLGWGFAAGGLLLGCGILIPMELGVRALKRRQG